jgi:hypothetical protein
MKIRILRLVAFFMLITSIFSCNDMQELSDPCVNAIEVNSIETSDSFVGASDGSIRIDINSRNGSSVYSIDGQNFQSSSLFTNLSTGTSAVYIKDELNCEINVNAEIKSILPVSYFDDIVPILETNCMVPSCHCDGNSLCFDNYELVSSYAAEIQHRTSQRNMPPSYSGIVLSDQAIKKIADWVRQGAPNN